MNGKGPLLLRIRYGRSSRLVIAAGTQNAHGIHLLYCRSSWHSSLLTRKLNYHAPRLWYNRPFWTRQPGIELETWVFPEGGPLKGIKRFWSLLVVSGPSWFPIHQQFISGA